MSSNKSKEKIQKKVEASILDAITKLKSDEVSFNQYEKSKKVESESILIGDKSAQILWDLAIDKPLIKEVATPPLDSILSPESKQDQLPVLETTKSQSLDKGNIIKSRAESAELKTIAIDLHSKKDKKDSPPTPQHSDSFSSKPEYLSQFNLLQYKLYEGEHLKIAQNKIEELESTIDKLRNENERLATASDLFQKRSEESVSAKQEIEKKLEFNEGRFNEERSTLKSHIEQRDVLINELKEKVELLESRLSTDIRKSRSKERELENRLELARLEKISLVGSKDDIILDLKRQVDQLNHELGNYRRKTSQMNQTLESNQEQFRRTVRALRLALTNLEVNDPVGGQVKKAE